MIFNTLVYLSFQFIASSIAEQRPMFQNYATGTLTHSTQGGSSEEYQTLEVHTEPKILSQAEDTHEEITAINEYPRFSAITANWGFGADIQWHKPQLEYTTGKNELRRVVANTCASETKSTLW